MTTTFRDLGVHEALCDALADQGITHPFPIQELTLPLALKGNDLIAQARTGTGKTLGFGLPLLQRLDPDRAVTQALVVVPTRELCLQVHDDLSIGSALGLTSISVYGGVGYDEQHEALTSGVHVVVGTPGRLLDHLNRGTLDLSQVTQLVLDEADEMLDMGFLPDVERLIEACQGEDRHTMLFSATMPTAIVKLARRYMDHPTFTRADTEAHETAPNVEQHFLQVHRMDKPRVLARILQAPERGGVYVFVRTKQMADRLVDELEQLAVASVAVHGDLRQQTRERNLDRFRSGKATVLVATEVAARGLDVTGVTHVVNYDCPDDEKMYLHRIGRTARAGEAGVAVTFAEFNEVDRLNVIRKAVGQVDTPVEPVFSTSERLTELFDLPEERPWDHLAERSRSRDSRGDREARSGRGQQRGGQRDRSSGSRASSSGSRGPRDEPRGRRDEPRRRDDAPRERGGDTHSRDETPREDERATRRSPERRASSDGRPKSARRAEGRGGDHDARPRPRTEERTEERTEPRTRTRTRTRSRPRPDDPAMAAEGTTTDQPATDQPTERRTGDRGRTRARPARVRAADQRPSEAPSTAGRDGKDQPQQDPGADRQQRSGQRARGREQSSRDRSSGSRDRDPRREPARPAPEPVTARGEDARGEGQPQLARRVRVEHLP